jgi:hypothetical protein
MRLGKTKTSFHYLGNLLSKTFNSKFTKENSQFYIFQVTMKLITVMYKLILPIQLAYEGHFMILLKKI